MSNRNLQCGLVIHSCGVIKDILRAFEWNDQRKP